MQPLVYSVIVLVCTVGAAAIGFLLHRRTVVREADDLVLLASGSALGLAATLTAVVVGLVTASAATEFEQANTAVATVAAEALDTDHILRSYGPDAAPIRLQLKQSVQRWTDRVQAGQGSDDRLGDSPGSGYRSDPEAIYAAVAGLTPTTDMQRELRERALALIGNPDLVQHRWLFTVQPESMPKVFFVVVLGWMILEFLCFGLCSPRGAAVYLLIGVAAVVVSSAMFLILELKDPINGYVRVSVEPLTRAITLMGS